MIRGRRTLARRNASLGRETLGPERKSSMGKDWHAACLRCSNPPCNKTLPIGNHAEGRDHPIRCRPGNRLYRMADMWSTQLDS
uniref:Uncharacterized protein n=1 Tax=Romanomermis culicivorax TaxID=13658 RepID=A0A915HZD8_ROMCU